MDIDRRKLLAAAPAFLACSAFAEAAIPASEAPPALQAYERETGGRVGVHAENIVTGAKIAWRADERFVMCSSFKASLAAHILKRVDRGQEHLERVIPYTTADLLDYAPLARQKLAKGAMTVAEMCAGAVELSDNTCANLLLAQSGGPAALTAFWRETGDTVTRLDNNEPALNYHPVGDPQDTTTPAAMAATLRRFVLGDVLSPASRARLTGWMVNCKTGDNRLRAGLPKDWKIGDKTGNNGKDAAADIAVTWPKPDTPILIAAYVQGGSPTSDQIAAVYAEIGRMVGQQLS
jgi:beta-lactamase class A